MHGKNQTPPGGGAPNGAKEVHDEKQTQPNIELTAEQIEVPCVQRPRLHTALSVLAAMHGREPFVVCGEDGEPGYMVLEVWTS